MRLPLFMFFARTMREETRSLLTYSIRTFFVAIFLMILLTARLASITNNAPGLTYLAAVLNANLTLIALIGSVYFATAITEEKEDMTLGLLKMSGLNPVSILLGKSTSRMLGAMMLLLAQVPFAVLAVTLGGVPLHQVFASYATIIAFTFLLCNLGLLFSVTCDRGRRATAGTLSVLVMFLIFPGMIDLSVTGLVKTGRMAADAWYTHAVQWLCHNLKQTSPFTQLAAILRTGFREPPISYQVVSSLAWGVALFGLAWASFNLCTRNQKEAAPSRGFLVRGTGGLRIFGAGRAWQHAVAWKDFCFVGGGFTKLIGKTVVFALLLAGCIVVHTIVNRGVGMGTPSLNDIREVAGYFILIGILAITWLEAGVHASRFLSQEVQWKTLSSLIMLPISRGRLLAQKARGLGFIFLPNLLFIGIGMLLIPEFVSDAMEAMFDEPIIIIGIAYGLAQLILFLYLTAVLSLFVKWGAFPLAIIIMLFGHQFALTGMMALFFGMLGFMMGEVAMHLCLLTLIGVTAVICVVLNRVILKRIVTLAGQT